MATTNENSSGFKTFQATAVALEANVRVTYDSNGLISAAGATDLGIGVTQEAIAASGYGTVKLWGAPGTYLCQTAGAVTKGAQLYTAASGEVDDSGTYKLRLIALDTATAQGDVIECAQVQDATYATGQYVSSDVGTVAAAGNSQGTATAITKLLTYVTAADGTKGVVLPTAAAGLVYEIYSTVATNGLVVYPASSDDINDGTTNAAVTIEGKTFARFVAVDDTTWAAMYTANS
jgi:hypothetical protein